MKPPAPKRSAAPSIFLRLFLSHLTLVLICFACAVGVFVYLFPSTAQPILAHSPLLIIPVVLAVIGIAGLLTTWTASAISASLGAVERALTGDDPLTELHALTREAGTKEAAELVTSLRTAFSAFHGKAARIASRRFQDTVRHILIVDVDPGARIRSVNAAVLFHTGRSAEEIIGKQFLDFVDSSEYDERTTHPSTDLFAESSPIVPTESVLLSADGRALCILWNTHPIFNEAGDADGWRMVGVFRYPKR